MRLAKGESHDYLISLAVWSNYNYPAIYPNVDTSLLGEGTCDAHVNHDSSIN